MGASEQALKQTELIKRAKKLGKEIGNDYLSIWDSEDVIQTSLHSSSLIAAQQLLKDGPIDNSKVSGFFVGVIWLAGFLLTITQFSWWYFIGFGILGWLVLYWGIKVATYRATQYKKLRESVIAEVFVTALAAVTKRKEIAINYEPGSKSSTKGFVPKGPMPSAAPYGVSHEGAETLVAHWMRFLGEEDAEVTRFAGDGGIDVQSLHYIAQVKNYKGSVSVAEVRQLQGVASADGRKPLFFTSGSYTAEGLKFADSVGMAMFIYNAENGTLTAACKKAKQLLETGL